MRQPSSAVPSRRLARLATAALLLATAACGSSHGSAASAEAGRCAIPRVGVDPFTGQGYPDRQGSLADEKAWVKAWIDAYYLWYREVPAANPASFPTVEAWFDVLKTPALTATGQPKDRFHFTLPTAAWEALAQSGVEVGYGAQWVILAASVPRQLVTAYVEPGSPAALAGVARGTEVLAVDGVDLVNGTDVATLNAGLFPATAGEQHTLTIRDAAGTRAVTLTAASVTGTPVPPPLTLATGSGKVGYLLFNDHNAIAEAQLVSAIGALQAAAVTDLVLDLRYNGGGYLDIASELAFMIAGPSATTGKSFERIVFNDKYPTRNPITGQPLSGTPFHAQALGFSSPSGTPLPSLGLPRVFVLTGGGTCSASEAVLNGLRGAGVQVVQVGATTCGKPYGFYPEDNCGTTFFSIQFKGVNELGFGDYTDGFTPAGAGPAGLPGCVVADDYGHALGDPAEARLAAALSWRASGSCTPAVARRSPGDAAGAGWVAPQGEGRLVRSPFRENRILRR